MWSAQPSSQAPQRSVLAAAAWEPQRFVIHHPVGTAGTLPRGPLPKQQRASGDYRPGLLAADGSA